MPHRRLPVRSCRVIGNGDAVEMHHTVDWVGAKHLIPGGRVDVAEAAARVRLADVIGVDTTCVRSDVTIEAVVALLIDGGLRAVPVVDESRRLVGIVSKTDLLRPRGSGKKRRKLVADIMTPVVHGLPEDAPMAYAISLMAFEGLHEVPVVDAGSHVVGMITSTDALRWVAQSLGYVVPGGAKPAKAAKAVKA